MSSQTVYFSNPTVISNLQSQSSSMSGSISSLQNQVGYGQTLSANCATYLTTGAYRLQNSAPISFATGGSFDAYPISMANPYGGHPGCAIYGGNTKSDEEFFARSNRPVNNSGTLWNYTGTVFNGGSLGKMLTGLVCTKMIEEGIIKPTDTCVTYWPAMTGTAYYYDTITVSSGTHFPYTPQSYTATTGSFLWQSITINHLLHFYIGIIQGAFAAPPVGASWAVSSSNIQANSYSGANSAGLGALLQFATYARNVMAGTPITSGLQIYMGATGAITNSLAESVFEQTRNGTIILAYKPGTYKNDYLPYNVRLQPSTYDSSWYYLGIVLDRALKLRGSSYCQYAHQKFLDPLGMTKTYILNQETLPAEGLADVAWRRTPLLASTNYFYNVAQPLTGTNNPIAAFGGYSNFLLALDGSLGSATQELAVASFPLVYGGIGCDNTYATGANSQLISSYLVGNPTYSLAFVQSPLVWSNDYPNDGISKLLRNAFYNTGARDTTWYPIGNSPILTTLKDYSKLIKLILNRGLSESGQRLLKTESWAYVVNTKITPLTLPNSNNQFIGDYGSDTTSDPSSFSFCMGFLRGAKDLSTTTVYGIDENTLWYGGFTNCKFYADIYTGNWFITAANEYSGSAGTINVLGGTNLLDTTTIPDTLIELIRD